MKISIIIPIYNVSNYIERCLDSALKQTYNEIEYILVNDATPDNSMELVNRFLSTHTPKKYVKIINHTINKGLSAARNTGVKNSTGDYIYFLDSDDEISPDCIEELVKATITTPDFVIGDIKVIGQSGKKYPQITLEDQTIVRGEKIINTFLSHKWYEMAWNKLINRNIFFLKNCWFQENILHEDNLWSFQLANISETMVISRKKTYIYNIRDNSISYVLKTRNYESCIFIMQKILSMANQKDFIGDKNLVLNYLTEIKIYLMKNFFKWKEIPEKKREILDGLHQLFSDSLFSKYKVKYTLRIKDSLLFFSTKMFISLNEKN